MGLSCGSTATKCCDRLERRTKSLVSHRCYAKPAWRCRFGRARPCFKQSYRGRAGRLRLKVLREEFEIWKCMMMSRVALSKMPVEAALRERLRECVSECGAALENCWGGGGDLA